MKLYKFLIPFLLIFCQHINAMDPETEKIGKFEIQRLFELIRQLPPPLQQEIIKFILSEDPDQIESEIEYLHLLSQTPGFVNFVNNQIFVNWAIRHIANNLKKSQVEAAILLRTYGAHQWLLQQISQNPKVVDELNLKFIDLVKQGSLEKVKFLLITGIPAGKKKNIYLNHALGWANLKDHKEIADLLKQYGAKLSVLV